jgi:hypothetical protein
MDTAVIILLESPEQIKAARILVDSLRSFGGEMSKALILFFKAYEGLPDIDGEIIETSILEMDERLKKFPLAAKVYACAQAEKMYGNEYDSLIWMNPETLVIKPPKLLDLSGKYDLAIRPVHIRNVGSPAGSKMDEYWQAIYDSIGIGDCHRTVESFVDGQKLRAYYNTHVFSVNPKLGLLSLWREHFEKMALDETFQSGPCCDILHKIFLHQAVLSVLIEKIISNDRLLILSPDYSYPYNLQDKIPSERQSKILNELTVMVYEQRSIKPDEMKDIGVEEPLRSWLVNKSN